MNILPKRKRLTAKTIVHVVTGSIAAYKAGDLVTLLREEGARVLCVLTSSARHFATPLVLRALSGERVYEDLFEHDSPHSVIHTELAEKADLILVSPASADFIARLAVGLTDDLASCLILASIRPVLLAPAMNDRMFQHPITARNLNTLREIGYQVIEPIVGHLVCGKEALGHVADDAVILENVVNRLSASA